MERIFEAVSKVSRYVSASGIGKAARSDKLISRIKPLGWRRQK